MISIFPRIKIFSFLSINILDIISQISLMMIVFFIRFRHIFFWARLRCLIFIIYLLMVWGEHSFIARSLLLRDWIKPILFKFFDLIEMILKMNFFVYFGLFILMKFFLIKVHWLSSFDIVCIKKICVSFLLIIESMICVGVSSVIHIINLKRNYLFNSLLIMSNIINIKTTTHMTKIRSDFAMCC